MARFPSNPSIGDQYFDPGSGITYTWDGYKWETTGAPFNLGATGATGLAFGVFAFAKTEFTTGGNPGPFLASSNGIASVTRISNGRYRYTLRDAQPNNSYVVQAAYTGTTDLSQNDWNILVENVTTTTFEVYTYRAGNSALNSVEHSVVVYGVDAFSNGGVDGPNPSGSAYNSWLRIGNVGTESDFINYITGATGVAGIRGDEGATGPQGTTGPVGATGPRGDSIQLRGSVQNYTDLVHL